MKFEIIFIDQITKNLQLNYDVRIKIYFETLNKYTKEHTHFLFLFLSLIQFDSKVHNQHNSEQIIPQLFFSSFSTI